jgi:hypothetical protein
VYIQINPDAATTKPVLNFSQNQYQSTCDKVINRTSERKVDGRISQEADQHDREVLNIFDGLAVIERRKNKGDDDWQEADEHENEEDGAKRS